MTQTPSSPSTPPATIELHNGPMRLALRADLGGSIAGLWHHDLPVLRSVEPQALAEPRQGGSFPLVPYSNRLGYMRFRWAGRDHTTQPQLPRPAFAARRGLAACLVGPQPPRARRGIALRA